LRYGTPQFRILLLLVALGLSACQTMDDAPVTDSWNAVPAPRAAAGPTRLDRTNGAPLLANPRGGPSTVIEGSGRFVGEPPTGSISRSPDDVADGVTLNLVNVPAPQAAKTILGDILAVKYTVDPGIEGKITIQTPKPVARAAVIDLFEAALRSNKAALVPTSDATTTPPLPQP
jgi:general secretion pathway protein D